MKNQNAKLMCKRHPNQNIKSIDFDENNGDDSRLFCCSCFMDLLNQNHKQKNYSLVDIDEFMINPISQLQRVMKYDGAKAFSDLDYLQQFEKEINQIEHKFNQTIIGLKTCVQQIRSLQDKFQQDLQEYLRLNTLIEEYYRAIYQQDNQLKKMQIKSFEEQLNFVSQNLQKAKLKARQNFIRNYEIITNQFQNNLQAQIQDIKRLQEVLTPLNQNILQGIPILIYGELINFPLIHYTISEGKDISYQLLYQGSRDGLNLKQYYSKCQNQSHLLTIITTKNGNKFGGYSPSQLMNKFGNETDPQLKSFLFQYNKKEIYKIKNQKRAQDTKLLNCQFGDGDLVFDGSFTKFSSNLGVSYDISNYDVQDRSTHIFGESNPQIQEFKVYKVIFQ